MRAALDLIAEGKVRGDGFAGGRWRVASGGLAGGVGASFIARGRILVSIV
jgi:hypothetical protein